MADHPEDPRIPDLVSLRQAADMLGLKHAMTHRLVQRGELRGKRVDSVWIFRRSVVERLKERRSRGSA